MSPSAFGGFAISDLTDYDIDHDHTDEILASGHRDEDGRAFIAVLEMDNLWGLSPQYSCGRSFSRELPHGTVVTDYVQFYSAARTISSLG